MNPHSPTPPWEISRGIAPEIAWQVGLEGPLQCFCLSRETRNLYAADETGAIYRIDETGRVLSVTRLNEPARLITWSDSGDQGAVLIGEDRLVRLDDSLRVIQDSQLSEECLALAITPFGNQLAVALRSGKNQILNNRGKRVASFDTMRPLAHIVFCSTDPLLFGSAEHGLICCYTIKGELVWKTHNLANVGRLMITGEGDLLYTASFNQGLQALNGDGEFVGSYLVEGTLNRADVTYEPRRIIMSTVEQTVYWSDDDGDQIWVGTFADQIVDVKCSALGDYGLVGLRHGGLYQMVWHD